MAIRIFMVEDHEIYRDGIRMMLETVPDLELVGEAASAEDALVMIPESQPDLVLMDIKLPGMNGIEATRAIIQNNPQMRVLVLSMYDDDPSVFAAMQAGAHGYILKGTEYSELLRAIEAVGAGEAIFGAGIATRMMHYFSRSTPGESPIFEELSEREHDVLRLIAQGLSNSEIARRLELRPKTVRNLVSLIVSKLHVLNRTEAAEHARDRGM